MTKQAHMLPVWFFIGALLTAYGVIILTVAISNFDHPANVVLAKYHADLFAGILLILVGGLYTYGFWPGRKKK